ncbi:2-dehydropantoate 2-reductase [Aquibacillus halophilus]|uniref:2-dehydropantoate 2-reductase n=1 Tax=Aquibacillus halophilus TaxID=930132 RepID=A0A6A8D979_9BACI|nr:2-dehydropantoate 2-reductase [Aquibacillus halophilus]MRH42154.1 2-dehydropantoate 2-reductase [Aquibacillus halophilus]
MKIGIIGGGSIGLLMASILAGHNNEITLYVRRVEQMETINKNGITIFPNKETYKVRSLLLDDIDLSDEMLLVCVKQYQLTDIYPFLLNSTCPLIFLQNGMGHIEDIQDFNFTNDVLLATSEHGAIRESDSIVRHTGKGHISIASLSGISSILDEIHSLLVNEDFPIKIEGDWFTMLARKLVINAVINPITAIFQVENGEIIKNPYLKKLSEQLCKEVCSVLQVDSLEHWNRVVSVASNTQNNHSSMKVDVFKRRRTEIDGILGYILKQGEVNFPYTSFAYNSIKALEWNYKQEVNLK